MKIPEILFEDVVIETKFNFFKLMFQSHDVEFQLDLENNGNDNIDDINVKEVVFSKSKVYFENTEQEYIEDDETIEIKSYNFFKDFYSPAVKKIPANYKANFHDYLNKKSIYGIDAKTDFYDTCIKNLQAIYLKVINLSFLNSYEKELLAQQIADCQDYLGELKVKIKSSEKIPFTLNNEQLTALFYLLRNNNVISKKLTNPELGKLMQNSLFYSTDKSLQRTSKYLYNFDKNIKNTTMDKLTNVFRDIFFK